MTDDIITRYDGVLEHIAVGGGVIRFEGHLADDVSDVSGAQYAALGLAATVSAS